MAPEPDPWFAPDLAAAALEALARVQADAAALRSTVAIARALQVGGRDIDLQGLDERTGILCARALDLPPEQGRIARVALMALREELDTLIGAAAVSRRDGP